MVYRSKDFTSLLSLGGLVKEYSNNCTNSCYLDRVGHSQDSKIERVHRDSLNKYPINLNSVFGIHRTEHIPCVKSVHRRIQTLADDIPWGAPVFFAWLMTYFFLIILTRTILSRKQLLSLWTWSVTHEFWFGLASPSSASTIFSNVITTQLPEACHASRRATRAWTVLTQTPSYSTGRTLPVHRHIRAFVANSFPLRPISSVMQCDRLVCRWYVSPA